MCLDVAFEIQSKFSSASIFLTRMEGRDLLRIVKLSTQRKYKNTKYFRNTRFIDLYSKNVFEQRKWRWGEGNLRSLKIEWKNDLHKNTWLWSGMWFISYRAYHLRNVHEISRARQHFRWKKTLSLHWGYSFRIRRSNSDFFHL